MGTLRRFWQWPRPASGIAAAAASVLAVLPTTIITGSASAASAAGQAPVFTSAPAATFLTGIDNSYIITATCSPACTFTETGSLPPGTGLSATGDLGGDPPAGSEGVYQLTITASDTAGTATQTFTLRIAHSAAIGVEGADGQLWAQAPQLRPGWQPLGGKITAPPAVAAAPNPVNIVPPPAPAAPVFVATGTNGMLWIRSVTDGWQEIHPSAVTCLGAPAAVITGNSTLTVACEGLNHALWVNSTTWAGGPGLPLFTSPWQNLGGILSAGPAAAPVNGTMTFFVLGTSGQIYTRTMTTGYTATPWHCIGQAGAAAWPVTNATSFVCQGSDHAFWEADSSGSTWAPPWSPGGSLIGSPAISATPVSTEQIAEGTDHAVWVRPFAGSWLSIGGIAVGGVAATGLS